jgi:hypothetical protein
LAPQRDRSHRGRVPPGRRQNPESGGAGLAVGFEEQPSLPGRVQDEADDGHWLFGGHGHSVSAFGEGADAFPRADPEAPAVARAPWGPLDDRDGFGRVQELAQGDFRHLALSALCGPAIAELAQAGGQVFEG